ncbi:hypothetical protein KIKIMORA_02760 [Brevundimonas phage vB_BpoS-Kikimora]|uniref:Uncharacterized protein n=1 Tax=Brevundimonas phage vB_BpoS-Kikimora TaxID=2948601 RepID=A0A9E7MSU1_9CAUD|nr:hypothetical protein KIKIMORA_02760 [Brevundimonas phage vB_BpoS-Kikimora]
MPLSFAHRYGDLHAKLIQDENADEAFTTGISNAGKVRFIGVALGLDPELIHLDMPFTVEDWMVSDDASKLYAGLYLCELRRRFFVSLFREEPALRQGDAWRQHAEAEHWAQAFHRKLHLRENGTVVPDSRTLQ